MADIALTKVIDPDVDYHLLAEELKTVDRYFDADRPQHTHRRFEYAMALRAWRRWRNPIDPDLGVVYDIGGAGSPFRYMIAMQHTKCTVVDPDGGRSLADAVYDHAPLADAVFCLSVLEHIPAADYETFLYHLACLVAPGGLLFLTFDYWSGSEIDTAHFHWMRQRIYTKTLWTCLLYTFETYQFSAFGGLDLHDHPPCVYDYSFASLALIKRS